MGFTDIEIVVLGVDPALHTSGAAILVPDYGSMDAPRDFCGDYVLHEFGRVTTQNERARYIESLLEMSAELEIPAVVVAETWDPPRGRDTKWTYSTILGIGEGWGRWSAEIETANEYLQEESRPEIILSRVLPNNWRDCLFTARRPKDTETLKATAQHFFTGVFGYPATADVAEAGCIALSGLRSTAIAEAAATAKQNLPKKKRRKKAP